MSNVTPALNDLPDFVRNAMCPIEDTSGCVPPAIYSSLGREWVLSGSRREALEIPSMELYREFKPGTVVWVEWHCPECFSRPEAGNCPLCRDFKTVETAHRQDELSEFGESDAWKAYIARIEPLVRAHLESRTTPTTASRAT